MNATSVDIKDYLEAYSDLGLEFAENLFIGREPETPSNTVTIFDLAGAQPQLNFDRTEQYLYENIQIRIRNQSYQTGYALAKNIETYLHGVGNTTINETYYSSVICALPTMMLDWDNNNRVRFVITFNIQRR
jgi:hypothetical protein